MPKPTDSSQPQPSDARAIGGPGEQPDGNRSTKAMNLRLSREQARELEMVAEIDGMAIAEVVRRAIGMYVSERAADEDFQHRSQAALAEHMAILKKFAG